MLMSSRVEASGNERPWAAPGASYDDMRAFLRLLNRRKWHILGVTALVCALTGLVLSQLTPEYRATALVMLDTRKVRVTNTPDVVGGLTLDIPAMQTEIEVLRSVSLLGRVVDKLRLDQDPEYGAEPISILGLVRREVHSIYGSWIGVGADEGHAAQVNDDTPRARAIASLDSRIRVVTRSRSYVIAVSLDSTVPAKAKQIVETITDFYVVDQLQAKLDANKRATEFFDDRLDRAEEQGGNGRAGGGDISREIRFDDRQGLDGFLAIAFGAEHASPPGARPPRRSQVAARCPSAGGPQSGHAWRHYGGGGQSHDFGAAIAGGRGWPTDRRSR